MGAVPVSARSQPRAELLAELERLAGTLPEVVVVRGARHGVPVTEFLRRAPSATAFAELIGGHALRARLPAVLTVALMHAGWVANAGEEFADLRLPRNSAEVAVIGEILRSAADAARPRQPDVAPAPAGTARRRPAEPEARPAP